ncbi:hypothetical protein MOBT1_003281 [Malassezia obtusa]|uniref:Guanine nucleotide-binding protein-like 3 N-terminal domain-containing protein n=1 Tax=Malassezia obtusa TaxID=76774 RepID=A0AAF0E3W9_9BASI|nr:hypothetical protein MOBT1_003281 [Malassezia obtusa]
MVRVKKRASKRQTTKQRVKVTKKVREHHRKQRREAKRNPQWKSRRREDPGIPNNFPYKEQLLDEIEQNRRLAEEKRMGLNQPDPEEEEEEDGEEEEQEVQPAPGFEEPLNLPHAPMLHAPLAETLKSAQIKALVYVLDARDPTAFRSAWLEAQLSKKSPELVYVLSKADLVPAEVLTGWVYRFMSTGRAVFPIAIPPSAQAQGVDALAEYLAPKLGQQAAAVVGFEHVGKTALATALQAAFQDQDGEEQVYDTPALVPSSASLPAPGDDEDDEEEEEEDAAEDAHGELARLEKQRIKLLWMLSRNQGNVQRFKDPQALVRTLLSRVAHPEDLMLMYGTPAFGSFVPAEATLSDDAPAEEVLLEHVQLAQDKADADTEQFLIGVARSVGRLKRKGIPDVFGAARRILRDWSHAGLGYYAKPLDRQKTVQASGSSADKARWEKAQAEVDRIAAVLPRKQWREQWQGHELRLNALQQGPLADESLVFAPVPEEEDDEEEDEEDVPVYGGEDQEGLDEEDEEDEDEDEDEEDEDEDEDEEDEEDEDEDEDEGVPPAKAPRKRAAPPTPAKPAKRAAQPTKPAAKPAKRAATGASKGAAPKPSAKRTPAPGEAYDLNAYF